MSSVDCLGQGTKPNLFLTDDGVEQAARRLDLVPLPSVIKKRKIPGKICVSTLQVLTLA